MSAGVLFVVPRFHTNLFFATRALVEAGFRVSVFARDRGSLEDHSFVAPRVFGAAPSPGEVAAAFREARPDLILLRKSGPLAPLVAGLARRDGTRLWGYDLRPLTQRPGLRKRLGQRLRGWPLRRVTPVRGLDPAAAPDPDARFLPWPVAAPPGRARQRQSGRELAVLCVGKLAQRRKNQHLVIAAIEEAGLAERVRLTLAGSRARDISGADEGHFAALAAAADRCPWITIEADVPFARMADLYERCDVCVLPSADEPLGIAPLEAMAFGAVPVISTWAGSAGSITDGRDGLRVEIGRAGALGAALTRLADEPGLVARLSAGALATASGELGPERFVGRVRALLESGRPGGTGDQPGRNSTP